ncbi:hypothetical protein TWF481_003691 [Arthrobotrys musiformis]|uniref:Uncharacterized protein n=1 Tax=Arthrobotrys musiformis TaxID=47236 RepID=A0AAV9WHD0_9PEZI
MNEVSGSFELILWIKAFRLSAVSHSELFSGEAKMLKPGTGELSMFPNWPAGYSMCSGIVPEREMSDPPKKSLAEHQPQLWPTTHLALALKFTTVFLLFAPSSESHPDEILSL